MPHLFDELTIRSVNFRNRIGVSPMCQYSCIDGMATDWHLVHLGSRAVGGAGLVVVEATAVEAPGRISSADMGLWTDQHIPPLARCAKFIEEQGAVTGIQLAHAGRKASTPPPWQGGTTVPDDQGGWEPVAPSPIPFGDGWRVPKELTKPEIREIQKHFTDATVRARHAGFRFLELHAAHGYLAHSFLSPLSNQRIDEYGGSFENRIRFVLVTAQMMRQAWPQDLPMSVRLSCTDWVDGGWTLEESVELSKRLKTLGVDIIDCSSGGLVPHAKIAVGPGYQLPFAEAIKRSAGIMTAAVGMISEPMQADQVIRNGQADMTLLARQMLRDPYWPVRAAEALGKVKLLPTPKQYLRAWPHSH